MSSKYQRHDVQRECSDCEQFIAILNIRDDRIQELECELEIWMNRDASGVRQIARLKAGAAGLADRLTAAEQRLDALHTRITKK